MYENNFWYLINVKKLTSLNYDNMKKYSVNLKKNLKPDNFFDLVYRILLIIFVTVASVERSFSKLKL